MTNLMVKNKPVLISEPWRMLLFLLLAQLLVAFVGRSIGPLGVLIGEDLSLTKSQIGMLPAALFLGQAFASVPAGFLTDRFGSRKLLVIAAFFLGLGFLVMTFLGQFWAVLFLVMIGGIGYGSMHPITNRGIIVWFPLNQRGTAMGIKQTGVTAGSALAGLILLPLGAVYGWRIVLLGACILLLISGMVSYMLYRDPPGQMKSNNPTGLVSFYKSMFNMLKNKSLMLVSFSAMGLNGSQMCLNTYLVLFVYEKFGISLVLSGILFVISEVSGTLGRIAWGMISDFLFKGNRIVILLIITVLTAFSSLTVALMSSATFWLLVPIFIVFGFSVSGFNGIWMNLASEIVPPQQAGISSGVSITFGSIGVMLVPPIFGLMVDQTGSFTFGWLFISGLMVLVFFMLSYLAIINKKESKMG
ncbi:MFS transporter [Mesobacillus maritimus]|uniref:MFS transporter n=1 Tax=Mesobacillus maritimus TaxID=1643336 RepID=UPI00203A8E7E|nr:MFS transporter [Mesobacillus maritimus]MCM3671024.1 MFS transporter [Mesobacillus maritimus]